MKLLKDETGFTLVELTVGLAVTLIILAAATGMVISGYRFFFNNAARNEAKLLGDTVFNYVKEELTYATEMQLFTFAEDAAGEATGDRGLTTLGGRLYCPDDVYGESFYLGRTVEMTAYVDTDGYSLMLTVIVRDADGGEAYLTQSILDIVNMRLLGSPILDGRDIVQANPYITYHKPEN